MDSDRARLFDEVHKLVTGLLLGNRDEDHIVRLEQLLRENGVARQVYLEYISQSGLLHDWGSQYSQRHLWPEIDASAVIELLEEDEKVQRERVRKEVEELAKSIFEENKRLAELKRQAEEEERRRKRGPIEISPVAALIAAACVIFVVFSVARPFWRAEQPEAHLRPRPQADGQDRIPPTVATLIRNVGGNLSVMRIQDSSSELSVMESKPGTRLTTNRYSLDKGIIEIGFDRGAVVVVESPAGFEIASQDRIVLDQGKAYSIVEKDAVGFSLQTASAIFVDLGTEFGVRAGNGASSVHVKDGSVAIAPHELPPSSRFNRELLPAGEARMVADDGTITKIPIDVGGFVRTSNGLLAFDSFDASNQSAQLSNYRGGHGFRGRWAQSDVARQLAEIQILDNAAASRGMGDVAYYRSLADPLEARDVLYFSANFRISGDDPQCSALLALRRLRGGTRGNRVAIGIADQQFTIRMGTTFGEDGVEAQSGTFGSCTDGEWHRIVAKLEFDSNGNKERLSAWLNPGSNRDAPDCTIEHDIGYTVPEMVEIRYWDMDGDTRGFVDNLRLGVEWAAVQ